MLRQLPFIEQGYIILVENESLEGIWYIAVSIGECLIGMQ